MKNLILFSLGNFNPLDENLEDNLPSLNDLEETNQFDRVNIDAFGEENQEAPQEKSYLKEDTQNNPVEIKVVETKDDAIMLLAKQMQRTLDLMIENSNADKGTVLGLTDSLNKLANVSGGAGRIHSRPAVDFSNIDLEDQLKKPDTFFAWSISKNIFDDFKNGIPIQTPYGAPIKFNPFTQIKTKGSNDKSTKTSSMCTVQIYSKRQSEFLRNHSEFGITFFESSNDSTDMSPDKADALQQASEYVKQLNDYQVKQRCLTPGSGVTIDNMDISVLRKKLTKQMAKNYEPEQDRIQRTILENTLKAKSLIGKNGQD